MKFRHLAGQLALAGAGALAGTILFAGGALAQTPTVTNTPAIGPVGPVATATATATAIAPTFTPTATAVPGTVTTTPTPGTPTATPSTAPAVPHDDRYFSQTGFRIDNDVVWDYFNRRGGISTFGYPSSRTFMFRGFNVQFFQRRVVELGPNGARQVNLLDPGLLNFTRFNNAIVPGVDQALIQSAPPPNDAPATLAFVQRVAPNTFNNRPVNYYQTFANTVAFQVAFPAGGDPNLLLGIQLEMWGVPTSNPAADPNNANFIYQRWQRGIMHYDAGCNCTQGLLLADYLKAILTGQNLPADVDQQAQGGPFYKQYDPTKPGWVRDRGLLPNTDLTNAFTQG
ncbi:MAG TPA: hypothetical protein VGL23_11465 [Chloroflexota bacterium]